MPHYTASDFATADAPRSSMQDFYEDSLRTLNGGQELAPAAQETPAAPSMPTPRSGPVYWIATAAAAVTAVAAVVLVAFRLMQPATAPAPQEPQAPQATPAPTRSLPSATPAATLPRALVAWDAPQGHVLGALTAGGVYAPTARFGSDWLQIDAGSGPVWVQAAELGQAAAPELTDLAPLPTPTPRPYVAPAAPAYVPPPQPTADLRPTQCVTTIYGQECSKDLDPNDQRVVQEIEAKSKAYNSAWFATATAQAQR